ncbi:MAG: hypothetical protein Q8S54_03905 [Bacteroidota bacterium]|nr:hypothetical protein [Odoribacter sp.]MDP3642319.1 hypothetical protein [Bacteroidota bacterium]
MDKQQIQERQQQIIDFIGEFCAQKLNEEYFELSKRLMQKLGKILEGNPFAEMVMVNGLIVPLNTIPEEYQKMVREARAEGKDMSFTTD